MLVLHHHNNGLYFTLWCFLIILCKDAWNKRYDFLFTWKCDVTDDDATLSVCASSTKSRPLASPDSGVGSNLARENAFRHFLSKNLIIITSPHHFGNLEPALACMASCSVILVTCSWYLPSTYISSAFCLLKEQHIP